MQRSADRRPTTSKNRNTFACALTQVLELAAVCFASRISPLTVTYCYSCVDFDVDTFSFDVGEFRRFLPNLVLMFVDLLTCSSLESYYVQF